MSPGWHGKHAQSWDRTRASIFDLWPRMYRIEVLAHADSLTSTSRIHLTDKAQRYFNRPGWGHNPSVSRTTSRSFWTALCTRFEILWLVLPSSGRSGASHQACHNVSKTSQDRESLKNMISIDLITVIFLVWWELSYWSLASSAWAIKIKKNWILGNG